MGRVGEGGMGQVYFGKSRGGRPVAVKVINPQYAEDSAYLARFESEAKSARQVSGAYTAAVVGAGPRDQPPWLAIEFVFGPTLSEAVTRGDRFAPGTPLTSAAVWCLAGGLVEALQAVHACGLVHRDLKPGNVLLDADGPKVIDFGIARGMSNPRHTQPGIAMGTRGYMSPEQCTGGVIGPESDVFSLGCVLVFAVTGANPVADSLGAAVRNQPGLAAAPAELRSLVSWCLHPELGGRPRLDQLMAAVVAGRARYPQAHGLNFWPEPLASLVQSAGDRLRRRLGSGLEDVSLDGPGQPIGPEATKADKYTPTELSDTPGDAGQGATQTIEVPRPPHGRGQRWPRPSGDPASNGSRRFDGVLFAAYRPHTSRGGVPFLGYPDAAAHALEGDRLWAERHYEAAVDEYRASIRLDDKNPVVHVDLGRALYRLDRKVAAERAFMTALSHAHDLIAAHRNLFLALDTMGGNSTRASRAYADIARVCRDVMGVAPAGPAGFANRGDAHCCLSQFPEATAAYEVALSLDPRNPWLLEKLSYARQRSAKNR